MKSLPTEQCVGMVLCQDITQILPGEFKGVLFLSLIHIYDNAGNDGCD